MLYKYPIAISFLLYLSLWYSPNWCCYLLNVLVDMFAQSRLYRFGNEVVTRAFVPTEFKDWNIAWPDYSPVPVKVDFKNKPWADPEIGSPDFKPKFNQLDGQIDRRSHQYHYSISADGYPLNPTGRTGIKLRGVLGRWGPNHAADPIVTRWKRDSQQQIVKHDVSNQPILQFISILREDVQQWAIPGGMVDPGEQVSATLKREFCEESLALLELSDSEQKTLSAKLKFFFEPQNGQLIYKGVVDDPRNTDNAWIETVAVNYHDQSDTVFSNITLRAGDDARAVRWVDIDHNLNLYANHLHFIKLTVTERCAYW